MNVDPKIKNSVGPYGIPYRSLIPVNTEGLLTAGRIISGTRLAMSSYRVQPICATIGEAAGTAAAMAALCTATRWPVIPVDLSPARWGWM